MELVYHIWVVVKGVEIDIYEHLASIVNNRRFLDCSNHDNWLSFSPFVY